MGEEEFKYILQLIVERGLEAGKEAQADRDSLFAQGRSAAYWEVLDTIKNRLGIYEQDLKEYGLDIDLEKSLL